MQKSDSFPIINSLVSLWLYCDMQERKGDIIGETLLVSEKERYDRIFKAYLKPKKTVSVFNTQLTNKQIKKAFDSKKPITKTKVEKVWHYNSSFLGENNKRSPDLLSLLRRGDQTRKILFINGKDKHQVRWAKKQESDKIILVSGNPFSLMLEYDQKFHFDLDAELFSSMGLKHVPGVVEIAKDGITVSEVVI